MKERLLGGTLSVSPRWPASSDPLSSAPENDAAAANVIGVARRNSAPRAADRETRDAASAPGGDRAIGGVGPPDQLLDV